MTEITEPQKQEVRDLFKRWSMASMEDAAALQQEIMNLMGKHLDVFPEVVSDAVAIVLKQEFGEKSLPLDNLDEATIETIIEKSYLQAAFIHEQAEERAKQVAIQDVGGLSSNQEMHVSLQPAEALATLHVWSNPPQEGDRVQPTPLLANILPMQADKTATVLKFYTGRGGAPSAEVRFDGDDNPVEVELALLKPVEQTN